jgi:hypothetical protein
MKILCIKLYSLLTNIKLCTLHPAWCVWYRQRIKLGRVTRSSADVVYRTRGDRAGDMWMMQWVINLPCVWVFSWTCRVMDPTNKQELIQRNLCLSEYNIAYVYVLFSSLYLDLASYLSIYVFRSRYMRSLFMALTHTTNPVSLHEMIFRNAKLCTTLTRGNCAWSHAPGRWITEVFVRPWRCAQSTFTKVRQMRFTNMS